MRPEDIAALELKVRGGVGLRQAVEQSGLHVKNTLLFLRDSPHKDDFKAAKLQASAQRLSK